MQSRRGGLRRAERTDGRGRLAAGGYATPGDHAGHATTRGIRSNFAPSRKEETKHVLFSQSVERTNERTSNYTSVRPFGRMTDSSGRSIDRRAKERTRTHARHRRSGGGGGGSAKHNQVACRLLLLLLLLLRRRRRAAQERSAPP